MTGIMHWSKVGVIKSKMGDLQSKMGKVTEQKGKVNYVKAYSTLCMRSKSCKASNCNFKDASYKYCYTIIIILCIHAVSFIYWLPELQQCLAEMQ